MKERLLKTGKLIPLEEYISVSKRTCKIKTPTSEGTGSLVSFNNRKCILTNNHVLESKKTCNLSYSLFFYDSHDSKTTKIKFEPEKFFFSFFFGLLRCFLKWPCCYDQRFF